ncbi:MAG: DUF362 domain-containing protein [Desulfobacterales bacterium]|nr:DUF362 domain-containing protein [Desulfobacterales bacterium]
MSVVSLVRCGSYDSAELEGAVEKSLEKAGFAKECFAGARVAVKPNLLTVAKDDSAIITHPEFFRAAVRIIRAGGGTPVLVESPAVHSLQRVIKKTGYASVMEEERIEAADPARVKTLHFESAHRFKYIDISSAYFDADMIVGLPKFKTHGITYITGAVKLMFGAMPGMEKSKMHLRLPGHEDFADFLLDLYGAMTFGFDPPKPVLHIMDAIAVLEGEGPGQGGSPRQMNAVLAGKNGIAVDCAATCLAGLDIEKVSTIVKGFERGYGISSPSDLETVGEPVENLQMSDFVPASGDSIFSNAFRWPFNTRTFKNLFVERPVPRPELCTLCYQCRKICPAGAISKAVKGKNIPEYDYGACIRCYCCLEICPEGAIGKKPGRLQWLLGFLEK